MIKLDATSENKETLWPLADGQSLSDLVLAGKTFADILKNRWETTAFDMTALTSFWPSDELIETAKKTSSFIIIDKDGNKKAWSDLQSHATIIKMDEKSFDILYPWHMLQIHEEILAKITVSDIRGKVMDGAHLNGVVVLGDGSEILPGVYIEGIAVIGKNCKVGPNCYLRGNTSIGDNCHIGQAVEIKNSLLMNKIGAGHLSYVGDSIICSNTNLGAGTITSNFRHDGMNHKSMVGTELIDTGRRKFGTIMGLNVHTGIHTSIYPGRKIGANQSTRPGDIVKYDLKAK